MTIINISSFTSSVLCPRKSNIFTINTSRRLSHLSSNKPTAPLAPIESESLRVSWHLPSAIKRLQHLSASSAMSFSDALKADVYTRTMRTNCLANRATGTCGSSTTRSHSCPRLIATILRPPSITPDRSSSGMVFPSTTSYGDLTPCRYCKHIDGKDWRIEIHWQNCDRGMIMSFLWWFCETYLVKRRKRAKKQSIKTYWRDFKMLYRRVNGRYIDANDSQEVLKVQTPSQFMLLICTKSD